MSNQFQSVLTDMQRWLVADERVWLCTIIETWGSSPRPAGSWLAVNGRGHWSGSVSGGCLEEDLINRVRQPVAGLAVPERPEVIDYGVTDNDRDRFQLPCGGRIRLLVEPMSAKAGLNHVLCLQEALDSREPFARQVNLATGALSIEIGAADQPGLTMTDELFTHNIAPDCRILLVGAGEVARYVAEFASAAGFSVTLCEPRNVFAAGWTHTLSAPLRQILPDDLVDSEFSDGHCAVLALAHDPRIDDMALLAALSSDCFYVGAMGSQRTSAVRRKRLLELGLPPRHVDRLRAPIGLDIPSKTPPEIAISITADLIAARHRLRAKSATL